MDQIAFLIRDGVALLPLPLCFVSGGLNLWLVAICSLCHDTRWLKISTLQDGGEQNGEKSGGRQDVAESVAAINSAWPPWSVNPSTERRDLENLTLPWRINTVWPVSSTHGMKTDEHLSRAGNRDPFFYLQCSLTTADERISRNFHLLLNLMWNLLTAPVGCCLIREHQAASLWEASRVPMSVNLVLPTMLGLSARISPTSLFFWGTHQDKKLRTATVPLKSCCEFLRDLSPVKSAVGAARVWRYRVWFWHRPCLFRGARC